MTAYQSKNQIQAELEENLPQQIAECIENDELPAPLKELILHNFQADYVCYNKENGSVEIGVEKESSRSGYPEMETQTYKLKDAASWLDKTYGSEEQDLKFYAKIIARNGSENRIDDVVLV